MAGNEWMVVITGYSNWWVSVRIENKQLSSMDLYWNIQQLIITLLTTYTDDFFFFFFNKIIPMPLLYDNFVRCVSQKFNGACGHNEKLWLDVWVVTSKFWLKVFWIFEENEIFFFFFYTFWPRRKEI